MLVCKVSIFFAFADLYPPESAGQNKKTEKRVIMHALLFKARTSSDEP